MPVAQALWPSDQQGNLYVEGAKADPDFPVTAGAYVSPVRSTDCSTVYYADPPGDVFVMKPARRIGAI
jgi:hypothetical protein